MFNQLRNIGPEKQSKKIVTPIAGTDQKKKTKCQSLGIKMKIST